MFPKSDNPFSPPLDSTPPFNPEFDKDSRPKSWLYRLGIWTIICLLSAGPSFFWGMSTVAREQLLAMCLGVAIFIMAYTIGDGVTASKNWRRDRRTRLTLRIGFITRMVISVVFPLGGAIDLFCGINSVRFVGLIMQFNSEQPNSANFIQTLVITLVQGIILNAVLVGYMLIVHTIQLAISSRFASAKVLNNESFQPEIGGD